MNEVKEKIEEGQSSSGLKKKQRTFSPELRLKATFPC
jgi:hypothetical protein